MPSGAPTGRTRSSYPKGTDFGPASLHGTTGPDAEDDPPGVSPRPTDTPIAMPAVITMTVAATAAGPSQRRFRSLSSGIGRPPFPYDVPAVDSVPADRASAGSTRRAPGSRGGRARTRFGGVPPGAGESGACPHRCPPVLIHASPRA